LPTARVAVKTEGAVPGFVDGAWWPRTRDLDLPPLLHRLAGLPYLVERVTCNLDAWKPAPRRLVVDGRTVRLDGFRSQRADNLTVIRAGGRHRLTLVTVPPGMDFEMAARVLARAAERDNVDSSEQLLRPGVAADLDTARETVTATRRWKAEGGSLCAHNQREAVGKG